MEASSGATGREVEVQACGQRVEGGEEREDLCLLTESLRLLLGADLLEGLVSVNLSMYKHQPHCTSDQLASLSPASLNLDKGSSCRLHHREINEARQPFIFPQFSFTLFPFAWAPRELYVRPIVSHGKSQPPN